VIRWILFSWIANAAALGGSSCHSLGITTIATTNIAISTRKTMPPADCIRAT
jgi:hypothetical protein